MTEVYQNWVLIDSVISSRLVSIPQEETSGWVLIDSVISQKLTSAPQDVDVSGNWVLIDSVISPRLNLPVPPPGVPVEGAPSWVLPAVLGTVAIGGAAALAKKK